MVKIIKTIFYFIKSLFSPNERENLKSMKDLNDVNPMLKKCKSEEQFKNVMAKMDEK